jgi:hypothetical protein
MAADASGANTADQVEKPQKTDEVRDSKRK